VILALTILILVILEYPMAKASCFVRRKGKKECGVVWCSVVITLNAGRKAALMEPLLGSLLPALYYTKALDGWATCQ
jgi:hypothetical protein